MKDDDRVEESFLPAFRQGAQDEGCTAPCPLRKDFGKPLPVLLEPLAIQDHRYRGFGPYHEIRLATLHRLG